MASQTEKEWKIIRVIIAFIFVWFGIILIFAPTSTIKSSLERQILLTKAQLGSNTGDSVENYSTKTFNNIFVDTGYVNNSYRWANHGNLTGTKLWDFKSSIKDRLKAFWYITYFGIYRLFLFLIWIPYLAPIVLAILIDGLVGRKISQWRYQSISGLKHMLAQRLMFRIINVAIFFPFMPIIIWPLFIPVGFIAFSLISRSFILNLGKRL